MFRRNYRKSERRRNPRRLMLPRAVTVTLVLVALISCRTVTKTDSTYTEILISEIPNHPVLPSWPCVTWKYEDGRYSLSEEDVDKVLNYLENEIPLYTFEVEQYEEQLQIVLDALRN